MSERPIFVVGLARSGTTLLVSLLDGHPDVMPLPHETHVFDWARRADPVAALFKGTEFGNVFPAGCEERGRFEAELRDRIKGPTDARAALLAVVEATRAVRPVRGATRWMEKTPRHLRFVPQLLADFGPGTRVVATVRDPRAVLASQAAKWKHADLRPVPRFARRWATAEIQVRRLLERYPQVMAVRYEDLVGDTEATMKKVAAHLQLPWKPTLVRPTEGGQAWGGNSSFGSGKGVFAGSLEKWKQQLEPQDVRAVERLLARRMLRWGYEPTTDVASAPSARRMLLDASAGWRAKRQAKGEA